MLFSTLFFFTNTFNALVLCYDFAAHFNPLLLLTHQTHSTHQEEDIDISLASINNKLDPN